MREHSACLLKEKGSERLHGTIDIIPSHLQLFAAADLSSPSHRVPLHTMCSRSRSKYPYEKMFRWKKFPMEQYYIRVPF